MSITTTLSTFESLLTGGVLPQFQTSILAVIPIVLGMAAGVYIVFWGFSRVKRSLGGR